MQAAAARCARAICVKQCTPYDRTGVKSLDFSIGIHLIIWYLKSRVPKVLQIVLKLLLRPLKSFQNPYGGLYGGFFGSFHYGKRLLVGVFVGKINTAQLGAKGPILGVVGASSVPILASTWSIFWLQ